MIGKWKQLNVTAFTLLNPAPGHMSDVSGFCPLQLICGAVLTLPLSTTQTETIGFPSVYVMYINAKQKWLL